MSTAGERASVKDDPPAGGETRAEDSRSASLLGGIGEGLAEPIADLSVVEVGRKQELRSLVGYLLGERSQPVIGLALLEGAEMTVLPPRGVRAIVGAGPQIYVIRRDSLLGQLTKALGRGLTVTVGAARIWWPGLARTSDPFDHPLVLQVDSEHAGSLLEEFARQFDLSRPRVREEIKNLDGVRGLLELELERTQDALATSNERLRDEQIARHSAERHAAALERKQTTGRVEELLHALIFREWIARLTEADRREHPLGAYILMPELLEQLTTRTDIPRERVAWVCATVAARRAPDQAAIALHPLVASPGGPQLERASDGAKGWRCSLKANVRGGPRLHYWERPDGTIEFTAVGGHDDPRIRERPRG
jgi:hypothetical protein